jgi:hypothetical protein
MLSTASSGYEKIDVIPKEITPGTNTIYVVYELNYSFPVSNFSLNLESDGIQFDSTSINIQYIEENKGTSGKIIGKITNNGMERYDISISKRYLLNGSLVSSIMHYHIYKSNESSNESLNEKLNNVPISTNTSVNTEQLNTINETINPSVEVHANNTTNDNSKEEVMERKSIDDGSNINNINKINNENKNENSSDNYLLYGILDLIMGVLVAVIVVYLYDL